MVFCAYTSLTVDSLIAPTTVGSDISSEYEYDLGVVKYLYGTTGGF